MLLGLFLVEFECFEAFSIYSRNGCDGDKSIRIYEIHILQEHIQVRFSSKDDHNVDV